jgi:hypothetical protein
MSCFDQPTSHDDGDGVEVEIGDGVRNEETARTADEEKLATKGTAYSMRHVSPCSILAYSWAASSVCRSAVVV